MSRDQIAGRCHTIKINNISFERVEELKILFWKKLIKDCIQGMFAIIRRRIFCLPVCYPNFKD